MGIHCATRLMFWSLYLLPLLAVAVDGVVWGPWLMVRPMYALTKLLLFCVALADFSLL